MISQNFDMGESKTQNDLDIGFLRFTAILKRIVVLDDFF